MALETIGLPNFNFVVQSLYLYVCVGHKPDYKPCSGSQLTAPLKSN